MEDNEIFRLQATVAAQEKALAHWRKTVDLNYVQIQRMYYALLAAKNKIEMEQDCPMDILIKIEDALSCADFVPPKKFESL